MQGESNARWWSGQATPSEIKICIAMYEAVQEAVEHVGLETIKRGPFFGIRETAIESK
jgi:hypothetical protein